MRGITQNTKDIIATIETRLEDGIVYNIKDILGLVQTTETNYDYDKIWNMVQVMVKHGTVERFRNEHKITYRLNPNRQVAEVTESAQSAENPDTQSDTVTNSAEPVTEAKSETKSKTVTKKTAAKKTAAKKTAAKTVAEPKSESVENNVVA